MTHHHKFSSEGWPFSESEHQGVFCTKDIWHNGAPVLTVEYHSDGDWVFRNTENVNIDDLILVCFGCMYQKKPEISEFSDIPKGWFSWRRSESDLWEFEEISNNESN